MGENMQKLELLSPAGDFERLKLAVKFGADAVYVGGSKFGMRSNPSNFDENQLKEAVEFVHSHGKSFILPAIRFQETMKYLNFLNF